MVTDRNLLQRATDAGAQLVEAERQALLARAEYHTAIRRLHLGGASLREIAEALSLSHQRVQQMVNAAGGSWWQVWKRRNVKPDAVCTWCDRPPSEVPKLIAGPTVFICDSCTQAAGSVISGTRTGRGELRSAERGSRARCSFCRKRADGKRSLVIGPANVCSECLGICREILNSRVT
ncbi:MAG TPA: ClpX C4-type zinc finger protein [Gemmatimonadaceae bacterium]|nr:ClpX C4-type zinc finger protein [Gemmatimonadaceae bacterium]